MGRPDAVLVFDPSAFPTKGRASVGARRPWCGRLGQLENRQVGLVLGSVTAEEHVLVDFRLDLPTEWARDRRRRQRRGVPPGTRSRTRPELARERLDRRGAARPQGGVSGDDALGRPTWFRRKWAARPARCLRAVPSTPRLRDLEAEPPPSGGRGPHPKPPFPGARAGCEAWPAGAWTRGTVRAGGTGPREVEVVVRRVASKGERRVVGFEEARVVVRSAAGAKRKPEDPLCHAGRATPREEFARVAKAERRIEECLKRGPSEAGLGGDQVRTWLGWPQSL